MTTSRETFCIRAGYTLNPHPAYSDDTYVDRIYQPDVYTLALKQMQETGAATLIDVGCGQGHKLMNLSCKVIGIDYQKNLEVCRARMPHQTWLEADLEREFPKLTPAVLKDSVVVCADVIEHLVDPTVLIRALTAYSKYARALVVSTPDREVVYGHNHSGPPYNSGHVREWTTDEFVALLSRWFTVKDVQLTNVDNVREQRETITVLLSRKEP
jgi:SAM-dependent methyltransferase